MKLPGLAAPAKINLFLHVVGQREDGMHLLQTVFQLLDFGDELDFEAASRGQIELDCNLPGVAAEDNLVVRAARALREFAGTTAGAQIRLRKSIPAGGGLGGGSSDAATTLLALNRLWGCGLDIDTLATLGVGLGADVPVFVRGHSAWAEGIGERLTPLHLEPRCYLVIFPGCPVNTAAIFRDRELTRNTPLIRMAAFSAGLGHNDCEPVARRIEPEVDRALRWLARHGEARMSGTGSCVFAAFADEGAAQEAAAGVPAEWKAILAHGVDRSPVHEALGY